MDCSILLPIIFVRITTCINRSRSRQLHCSKDTHTQMAGLIVESKQSRSNALRFRCVSDTAFSRWRQKDDGHGPCLDVIGDFRCWKSSIETMKLRNGPQTGSDGFGLRPLHSFRLVGLRWPLELGMDQSSHAWRMEMRLGIGDRRSSDTVK